jgi:proline iminopeptidase
MLWLSLILLSACSNGTAASQAEHGPSLTESAIERETLLDGKEYLTPEIVRELPDVARLCRPEQDPKMIDIGRCKLYCESQGTGPPLVLVNGGPGATHHYFHVSFWRAHPFTKVIYYDQRGCGLSEQDPGQGFSFEQAVDDLERLRKGLGIDRWFVLGHSYGGLLAQSYTITYPDSLLGLVLVGSSPGMLVEFEPSREYNYLTKAERGRIAEILALHSKGQLTMEKAVFNAFLNGDWKRQCFYKPTLERMAQKAKYEWQHAPGLRKQVNTRHVELSGAFKACPIPTLIAEGKWDLTFNTDKPAKFAANHPGAKLVMFESSAHNPFDDQPEQFFGKLEKFISSAVAPSEEQIVRWKADLKAWSKPSAIKTAAIRDREKRIQLVAKVYSPEWLKALDDHHIEFTKTIAFDLYDLKRYEESLRFFKQVQQRSAALPDDSPFKPMSMAESLMWQGHLLDLLGRREEAIRFYQQLLDLDYPADQRLQRWQYGINVVPREYGKKRLREPFKRVEYRYVEP